MPNPSFITQVATTFVVLFPIANPIAAVPVFQSLTEGDEDFYRKRQALKTAFFSALVLAVFMGAGKYIMGIFGIQSPSVIQIAGGLIVGYTGWRIVNGKQYLREEEEKDATKKGDVSFIPMAIPMISGPGAISAAITLPATLNQGSNGINVLNTYPAALTGIALLGIVVWMFLMSGDQLKKRLGADGMGAVQKISGFFILAIAVQLILTGTIALLSASAPTVFTNPNPFK